MKLGIYTANPAAQDRWERMQRKGFLRYILQQSFIGISICVGIELIADFMGQPHDTRQMLYVVTGAGVIWSLDAAYDWHSAKKKARHSRAVPVMVYPDEQRAEADSSATLRNDKQM